MVENSKSKRRPKTRNEVERGGVQSVRVAAAVLKALAAGGGVLPLKDIASATGFARAKVHRYLTSLRNAGLVSQNISTAHYQIGSAAVEIGLAGLRRISPVAEVCDALLALRDLINQTVTVAVWGENGPVIVAMQESDHLLTMNVRIGSRLPILSTAIGRTFLAHLPDAVTRSLVEAERRDARLGKVALPSVQEIENLIREINSRRLSRAPSALLPGVDAIAAPVFDYRNNVVAVLCVVARADAKITGWEGTAVRALTDMAAQLSARLGFVNDPDRSLKRRITAESVPAPKSRVRRARSAM
ncbi:MAG: IclR family transcriptional regulator [Xanthobacteraceae bacterium]|jgi:DNA-binding IclR family transcriptional regulator